MGLGTRKLPAIGTNKDMRKKQKAQAAESKAVDNMLTVKYPARKFFKRRITPLWDNFYRVTYQNELNYKLFKSYFVEVVGNEVKEHT